MASSSSAHFSSSSRPVMLSAVPSSVATTVGVRLDRVELLLLVSSALSSLGCVDTVRALRRETGITSEQRAVERVRAAILAGEWQQASHKCHKLLLAGEQAGVRERRGRADVVSRVSAILHAGRFLDQLLAAIDSQQPPVEALTTLTQHIAAAHNGVDGSEVEVEADSGDSGSQYAPVSFVDLCDRWLPSGYSSSLPPPSSRVASVSRPPRLSSLLCVLSSLLLCCSAGELSMRSGCDAPGRAWRPLLADRIIECLPRASPVPHNQLANMLALAALSASQQQQQQYQQQHPHQHSQLQQHALHPQPTASGSVEVEVSLLAAPPQSMSERRIQPRTSPACRPAI